MKKSLLTTLILVSAVFIFSGCNNEKKDAQETGEANVSYTLQDGDGNVELKFDIDRDGKDETLNVNYGDTQSDEQLPIPITIDKNGKSIWHAELAVPHAGWGSYYVVLYENNIYLLNYVPEESQGLIAYSYKLFWVDSDGNEIIEDEGGVDSTMSGNLEELKEEFNKKVSNYLENGTLLISTMEGEMVYYGQMKN